MSEQYPGPETAFPPAPAPPPVDGDATPVDGELLDAEPLDSGTAELAVETVEIDVIEGEAIDLDEDDEKQNDATDESASTGTGVLVLDTWQIQIPATGDSTVDAALARLTDVEGLPPSQHADVYEAVHSGLHEALADLDRA